MRFFKEVEPTDTIQVGGLDLPSNSLSIDGAAVTNFTKSALDAALAGGSSDTKVFCAYMPALALVTDADTRAFMVANAAGTVTRVSFLPFANYDGNANNYHMIKVTNLTQAIDVTQASGLNAVGALVKNMEHAMTIATGNESVTGGDVLAFDIAVVSGTGDPAMVVPEGVIVVHVA